MVSGAVGQNGQAAQKLAAKESNRELAHAQTHQQLTEENNALGMRRRHRTVTLSRAQVCYGMN